MASTFIALAIFAAYVPIVFLVHVGISRLSHSVDAPAQGAAARAVLLTTLLLVAVAVFATWNNENFGPALVYVGLGCVLIGYMYFVMFCNTESGRRYHALRLLRRYGGMDETDLRSIYSAKYMIEVRLDRLLKWRMLDESEGRLVVRKKTSLWVCYIFYFWSRILGFTWGQ